jgi:HEPN domain-containing protein
MRKLTAQWIKKAEADFSAAKQLLQTKPLLKDQIGFCCQQAVEKYLKALLQEWGLAIPYTHDITGLIDLLLPVDKTLRSLRRGSRGLTLFAVEYRYPARESTVRQARAAFEKAGRFRDEIHRRLGIRTRRRR